nr:MAG TPA: hypothetical protein [Caudoviricetes sp.]
MREIGENLAPGRQSLVIVPEPQGRRPRPVHRRRRWKCLPWVWGRGYANDDTKNVLHGSPPW